MELQRISIGEQILTAFKERERFNLWFYEDYARAYIRKSERFLFKGRWQSAELSNITAYPHGRVGFFLRVLRALEETGSAVYVENVLEGRLVPPLLRMGYRTFDASLLCTSFYKLPQAKPV